MLRLEANPNCHVAKQEPALLNKQVMKKQTATLVYSFPAFNQLRHCSAVSLEPTRTYQIDTGCARDTVQMCQDSMDGTLRSMNALPQRRLRRVAIHEPAYD